MLVAAYAAAIGRSVPFAQAAFRQAFAAGRALDDADSIVIAAAACEMHPDAVLAARSRRSVAERLRRSTAAAAGAGVGELPAIVVAGEVFAGERALEEATGAYAALAGGERGGAA
jgi:2-hydroxychromene-2-carboxylate isomerase